MSLPFKKEVGGLWLTAKFKFSAAHVFSAYLLPLWTLKHFLKHHALLSLGVSCFCLQFLFFLFTLKVYVLLKAHSNVPQLWILLNSFSLSSSFPSMILDMANHTSRDDTYYAGQALPTLFPAACYKYLIFFKLNFCVMFKHWSPETRLNCDSGHSSVYWFYFPVCLSPTWP